MFYKCFIKILANRGGTPDHGKSVDLGNTGYP